MVIGLENFVVSGFLSNFWAHHLAHFPFSFIFFLFFKKKIIYEESLNVGLLIKAH